MLSSSGSNPHKRLCINACVCIHLRSYTQMVLSKTFTSMQGLFTTSSSQFSFLHIILYLEEETEADPLVVLVVAPLQRVLCLVHTRVGNIEPNPLPEGTGRKKVSLVQSCAAESSGMPSKAEHCWEQNGSYQKIPGFPLKDFVSSMWLKFL